MAKHLRLKIKNTQLAAAVNLGAVQEEATTKATDDIKKAPTTAAMATPSGEELQDRSATGLKPQRARARTRSAFSEGMAPEEAAIAFAEQSGGEGQVETETVVVAEMAVAPEVTEAPAAPTVVQEKIELPPVTPPPVAAKPETLKAAAPSKAAYTSPKAIYKPPTVRTRPARTAPQFVRPSGAPEARERLGPTGRHIRDLIPRKPAPKPAGASGAPARGARPTGEKAGTTKERPAGERTTTGAAPRAREGATSEEEAGGRKGAKSARFREYQDLKPSKRTEAPSFDARDRQGLRAGEEEGWRGPRKAKGAKSVAEELAAGRPSVLKVRLPITVKDLASEMKVKASELIAKLFAHSVILTINDFLDEETLVQLLGHEMGCQISIDTAEQKRIRVTDQTVKEEISKGDAAKLQLRPPVVAFMGHVDHGKTSLIDAIRNTNRAAGEAGAITQHIGAFSCRTPQGNLTILDTPGHEAFSAMRARGADVTDIVVLVVAGDEGIRQQTLEAIQHARAAGVTIVVALSKCDKPQFNAETVYRQLAEQELLPEAWGGSVITVNCSATTGEGIPQLLEMLALQTEVLELKADPSARARGRVIESEMHKGMGATATVLVLNGTLHKGDAIVFDQFWGRVKTMKDDQGKDILEAPPSASVAITGLSGLPEAGQEFIVVSSEREARDIAEKRSLGLQKTRMQQTKRLSMEHLVQRASKPDVKVLNLVLRADVQGSLEALEASLKRIQSEKVALQIVSSGVGEISESDVQLAAASKATILGFHTAVESRAEPLIKETGITVRLYDIIYHAIDDVKLLMTALLDRIAKEEERGKAEVLQLFKSSQLGTIAGCRVTEGAIQRNCQVRVRRGEEQIWRGSLASLKRVKEDVREVQKGFECGIVLQGFKELQVGDILEAYEVIYLTQEL